MFEYRKLLDLATVNLLNVSLWLQRVSTPSNLLGVRLDSNPLLKKEVTVIDPRGGLPREGDDGPFAAFSTPSMQDPLSRGHM